jgi:hypothetical protein
MNTNDIIQEAAEAWLELELLKCDKPKEYYSKGVLNDVTNSYNRHCTHFLTHAKEKHGAELVKVEGDDEAIANHLFKAEVNTFTDSTGFEVQVVGYADFVTAINQALAIGREQGRRDYEEQQRKIFKQLPPKPDL